MSNILLENLIWRRPWHEYWDDSTEEKEETVISQADWGVAALQCAVTDPGREVCLLLTLLDDGWLQTPGPGVSVPAPPHHHRAGRAGLGLEAGGDLGRAGGESAGVGGVEAGVPRQATLPALQTWATGNSQQASALIILPVILSGKLDNVRRRRRPSLMLLFPPVTFPGGWWWRDWLVVKWNRIIVL